MFDFSVFSLSDFATLANTTTGPAASVTTSGADSHAAAIVAGFDWDNSYNL